MSARSTAFDFLQHGDGGSDGKQQQHANMPSSYQIFESNAKNYFHLKHSLPHFILFTSFARSLAARWPACLFVCSIACLLTCLLIPSFSCCNVYVCLLFLHFSVLLLWRLLVLSFAVGHMLLTGSLFCHYRTVFLLCHCYAICWHCCVCCVCCSSCMRTQ